MREKEIDTRQREAGIEVSIDCVGDKERERLRMSERERDGDSRVD